METTLPSGYEGEFLNFEEGKAYRKDMSTNSPELKVVAVPGSLESEREGTPTTGTYLVKTIKEGERKKLCPTYSICPRK